MKMQEELRINGHQPVVGFRGTEVGDIFDYWINKYGGGNIHFILSHAYNLGRVQGIRDERKNSKVSQAAMEVRKQ